MEKKIEEALEIIKEELNNNNVDVINELYDLIPLIKEKEAKLVYIPFNERPIDDNELDLSIRTIHTLKRRGYKKIGDIPFDEPDELMKVKGFGLLCARDLYTKAEACGLIIITSKLKQELVKCRILNEDKTKNPYGWHRNIK